MHTQTQRRWIVALTASCSFLTPYLSSMITVVLPYLQTEYAVSTILLGWTATGYLLSAAIFLIPLGRLADQWGKKNLLIGGVLIYTVTAVSIAFSPSILFIIVARFAQGLGASMIFATVNAILADVYDHRHLGTMLGINMMGVYIGMTIGPLIGGYLTTNFSWRLAFLINAPIGIILLILLITFLPRDSHHTQGKSVSRMELLVYGICLGSLMLTLTDLFSPLAILFFILAGTTGMLFIYLELHSASPLIPFKMFQQNHVLLLSNLTALMAYIGIYGISFLLSFYIQNILGLTATLTGMILLVQPLCRSLFSPIAGRTTRKYSPVRLVTLGLLITLVGVSILAIFTQVLTLPLIITALLLSGIGIAFFAAPNTFIILNSVNETKYGITNATQGTMRLIGDLLSMGVISLILNLMIGHAEILPINYLQFIQATQLILIVYAGILIATLVISHIRGFISPPLIE